MAHPPLAPRRTLPPLHRGLPPSCTAMHIYIYIFVTLGRRRYGRGSGDESPPCFPPLARRRILPHALQCRLTPFCFAVYPPTPALCPTPLLHCDAILLFFAATLGTRHGRVFWDSIKNAYPPLALRRTLYAAAYTLRCGLPPSCTATREL